MQSRTRGGNSSRKLNVVPGRQERSTRGAQGGPESHVPLRMHELRQSNGFHNSSRGHMQGTRRLPHRTFNSNVRVSSEVKRKPVHQQLPTRTSFNLRDPLTLLEHQHPQRVQSSGNEEMLEDKKLIVKILRMLLTN